jgi:hypothetical protein
VAIYINVPKERFDELFTICLDKLKLMSFSHPHYGGENKLSDANLILIKGMHRQFHYAVCQIKTELERA